MRSSRTKSKSKYGNIRTKVGGRSFHSKAEAAYYIKLRSLEDRGFISELACQPRFGLRVEGEEICTYIADFKYIDDSGNTVVVDVKGKITDVYRLKKKLFLVLFPYLDFQEIPARDAIK